MRKEAEIAALCPRDQRIGAGLRKPLPAHQSGFDRVWPPSSAIPLSPIFSLTSGMLIQRVRCDLSTICIRLQLSGKLRYNRCPASGGQCLYLDLLIPGLSSSSSTAKVIMRWYIGKLLRHRVTCTLTWSCTGPYQEVTFSDSRLNQNSFTLCLNTVLYHQLSMHAIRPSSTS